MIEIRHLRKSFGERTPLEDISVDIHDGDVIAVIGPSGCGKSTLLRCINLLEQPTAGSIRIDGTEITDPSCDIHRIRRKLGMVFQSFNLFQHLTAIENIMMPQVDLLGLSRQEAYDRGDFSRVEQLVYAFSDAGSNQLYWLAKSFIVLGDSFADRGDLEQAEATFNSILDGYQSTDSDDDVPGQVRSRLNRLNSLRR